MFRCGVLKVSLNEENQVEHFHVPENGDGIVAESMLQHPGFLWVIDRVMDLGTIALLRATGNPTMQLYVQRYHILGKSQVFPRS